MKPLVWLSLAILASCAPATPPHTALPPPEHLLRAVVPVPVVIGPSGVVDGAGADRCD